MSKCSTMKVGGTRCTAECRHATHSRPVSTLHPDRERDAIDFGFEPLEVLAFVRATGLDFDRAILVMDAAREASRR